MRCSESRTRSTSRRPWRRYPTPLPLIANLRLSEDIIGPILRLLLVETLVGGGRAARISRLRLGQRIDGQRRLVLEWETPRRYADRATERRCVEGAIPF